jgi:hypothetical protein
MTLGLALIACGSEEDGSDAVTPVPSPDSGEPTPRSDGDVKVELCPTWELGDKRSLELVENNERTVSGRDVEAEGRTPIRVTVAESTPDGYLFEWVYSEAEVTKLKIDGQNVDPEVYKAALSAQLPELQDLTTGITFELETDQCGVYLGIRNWREIAETLSSALVPLLEKLAEELPRNDVDFDAFVDEYVDRATSQEGIEALIGDNVGLYYGAFGDTYSLDEAVVYDVLAPNPFGGEPLPAVSEYILTKYDEASECGTVSVSSTYDVDEFIRIIEESIANISEEVGGKTPNFDGPGDLATNDESSYDFCLDSGWLDSVVYERVISMSGERRVEVTRITDKGPD